MNSKEIVYVSGPMSTSGEPGINLHCAVHAAATLVENSFLPFVPHLTWIMHAIQPMVDVEQWKHFTMSWVDRSDILLRLAGDSDGADDEVKRAVSLNIPVFYSMSHLLTDARARR